MENNTQTRKIPKLSIVIPVYNVEKYLARCLDSVLCQTFSDFEVICVDDGSTDNSLQILQQYAKRDARIIIVHKENGGVTSARKAGVKEAKGKYLIQVDSDDWIDVNMCKELVCLAEETDADIVTSGAIRDYGIHSFEDNEIFEKGLYEGKKLRENLQKEIINLDKFFQENIILALWGKLYKTSLIKKHMLQVYDEIRVGEDIACIFSSVLDAKKIYVSGKSYYHYCVRENSLLGIKNSFENESFFALCKWLDKNAKKNIQNIENIMEQYEYIKLYIGFLRCLEEFVTYDGEYLYPYGRVHRNNRIIIYGAGKFGKELKRLLEDKFQLNIVAWLDKEVRDGIQPIEVLNKIEYDKILIGVLKANIVDEIEQALVEVGVPAEKICKVRVDTKKR